MTIATTTVTPRRVYAVRDNTNGTTRLVRAINVAAALRHVVRIAYTVDVASQDDLIELLTSGVPVEDASAAEDEQPQGTRPRQRRSPQAAEAPQEADRDPRVPDMFEAKATPAEPAAAPATPAPTPPTAKAAAADAPVNTASAPNPAAASAAAEPQASTAADDLEDRVRALGTRLGTEQPRMPPDVVPLELLELVGVENPRLGDVLPWYGEEMGKVFWDAYYAAALPLSEVQRQAQQAAERQAAVRRTGHPPVRYRHPATSQTWTGRGLRPKWLQAEIDAGRSLSEFEVNEA